MKAVAQLHRLSGEAFPALVATDEERDLIFWKT